MAKTTTKTKKETTAKKATTTKKETTTKKTTTAKKASTSTKKASASTKKPKVTKEQKTKGAAITVIFIIFLIGVVIGDYLDLDFLSKDEPKYDSTLIETQITEISELATLEYRYKGNAEYDGGAKKALGINIPFTSKSMLVYYEGIVKIGTDFSTIDVDLDAEAETLKVTVPHSKILSHEIDMDSFEVLDVKNGLFNSVTPEDNAEFIKAQKNNMEKDIMEGELLAEADEKTKSQVVSFVQVTYPDLEVTVDFAE